MRSTLRDDYPGFLATFEDLANSEALTLLAAVPTPDQGARLTRARIEALLRKAGRQRRLAEPATQIHAGLRAPQLAARRPVLAASAHRVTRPRPA